MCRIEPTDRGKGHQAKFGVCGLADVVEVPGLFVQGKPCGDHGRGPAVGHKGLVGVLVVKGCEEGV